MNRILLRAGLGLALADPDRWRRNAQAIRVSTRVSRKGGASLHFEDFRAGNEAGNGRICAKVEVSIA